MFIEKLTLTNFRNHSKTFFSFNEGINLILGKNTSGKSNVLEALYFLAIGEFAKAVSEKEVISYGKDFCRIEADINKGEDVVNLVSIVAPSKETARVLKTYEVNKIKRLKSKFIGNFYAVLFSPESLDLVTDSPSLRRTYMDFALAQVDSQYRVIKPLYDKTVRNRNKILERIRDMGISQTQLDYWDIKILEYGKFVQEKRIHFFENVNKRVGDFSKTLSLPNLEIKYLGSTLSKESLREYRLKDIQAGITLVGPHRDDFEFLFNTRNLKSFGSRGEQRTAVLALKLCELMYIKESSHENPVLLLDDIFSELDKQHRETILHVCENSQTIITSADEDLVPESLRTSAKNFFL
ncbi:MAG: DNA replication and repair protein RecF [bacterium]